MVFDGKNQPGVTSYLAQNLQQARAYNFMIAAVNFNGVGPSSPSVTYFSCLPPQMIQPPQYVSSTEISLTVKWGAPSYTGGCPLQSFNLYINDG